MRILFLAATLTGGGAERQFLYLASELRARGHQVLVGFVRPGPGEWPEDMPTHRFPLRAPWSPALIFDIVQLGRSWKPDVVQTYLPRMDVVGGVAAKLMGVPHLLCERNSGDAYRDLKSRLRRVVGWTADAVVANSPAGSAYWGTAKAMTVPNGVPARFIASAEPVPRPTGPLLVYAGRLVPEKNVDIAIEAVALVNRETPVSLYVCGEGPERARLTARVQALGLAEHVRFFGFVRNAWSFQAAADVALLVSDFEGQPNVISECFAAGTPMILSDIPTHRSMGGDDVIFVPRRDANATAAAILHVLGDRESARLRANRAKARVAACSVPAMADLYADVYSRLIAG